MTTKININEKFSKFSEHWRPKIVAELNGQEFKLAKIKGAQCPQSIRGIDCNAAPKSLAISGGADSDRLTSVHVNAGEAIVVPKGAVHRPRAEEECHIFLIEPKDVKNNGDAKVDAVYDAPMGERI